LDAICLITGPRTGADQLCAVLPNFSELAAYRDVFGPEGVRSVAPDDWPLLRRLTGVDFEESRDFRLATFTQQQPTAWLDALEQVAAFRGKRVASFTLVRNDLSVEATEAGVLNRIGLRTILVVRKQIDSYVAMRMADEQTAGRSGPVVLDPDRFDAWLGAQERWYDHWKTYLTRRFMPCPVLRYETDIDQPADRVLKRFAGAAAQVGITLRPPATVADTGIEKEGPPAPMVEKVANWPAFSRELSERGIERRAFGYPL
jgi:hypothetical protein